MHPRLDPHFTANEGYEHDYRWNDFFHLMGAAPSGLCNMYVWHGLAAGAAKQNCDVLLLSEWGNSTFSDRGERGFVEYFVNGNGGQLWRALVRRRSNHNSILTKFLTLEHSSLVAGPHLADRAQAWTAERAGDPVLDGAIIVGISGEERHGSALARSRH